MSKTLVGRGLDGSFWEPTTHRPLLAAKQTLIDAAVAFAVIAETEPCVSFRYDAAMERLHQAAKDYTEASLRCGLAKEGV